MISQRSLRMKIRAVSVWAWSIAVFSVLVACASPAQQEGLKQTSVKAPADLGAVPLGVPARPALRPLPMEAETAGRAGDNGSSLAFLSPLLFDAGGKTSLSIVVADVNGDGKPDLLLPSSAGVSVLLGNGNGTFQPAVTFSTGGIATFSLAVADVNGDGKPDVVAVNEFCTNSTSSCVGVLLGNGDGTFQNVVTYDSGGFLARFVTVADVNRDGKLDVVVAHYCATDGDGFCAQDEPGIIGVLLGKGDGTFKKAVTYSPGGYETSFIAVGDLDGDGKPDLIVANQCAQPCELPAEGSVGVLLGNGDGTFQSAVSYDPGGTSTSSVIVVDLNGDNKLDLIASNSDLAGVLLGN